MSWLDDIASNPGLIAAPLERKTPPPAFCAEPDGGREAMWLQLTGFCNPSDAQHGPSCGGHALANALEIMLRRDAPESWLHGAISERIGTIQWQIDGGRIWKELRAHFYGNENGGLRMSEIADAPRVLGFEQLMTSRVSHRGVWREIANGPIVIGLALSDAWREPNSKNGYIRPLSPNPWAGHALCMMGTAVRRSHIYAIILNSWGGKWGYHGTCLVHQHYLEYCWIDDGVTITPESPSWWKNTKLLEYVIRHDEDEIKAQA